MTTYPHICPCGNAYSDEDVDVYFCPPCVEQRKIIAKQIDASMAGRNTERAKSDLQIAHEKGQARGNSLFVKAGDLGIFF